MVTKAAIPGGAIGLVETRGLVAAVVAADTMLKSAYVALLSKQQLGDGWVTVIVTGDVGAVQAATAAGAIAAGRVGQVVSSHIIARPGRELDGLLSGAMLPALRAAGEVQASTTDADGVGSPQASPGDGAPLPVLGPFGDEAVIDDRPDRPEPRQRSMARDPVSGRNRP